MKRTTVLIALLLAFPLSFAIAKSQQKASKPADTVKAEQCFECHESVKKLATAGKHMKLNCAECHTNLAQHIENEKVLPVTNLELTNCGRCHKEQYDSFMTVNYTKRAKREKATPDGRAPTLDKLLAGHGFTKEHAEPRSHAFMLIDQIMVDRATGGRYGLKNWSDLTKTGKLWDVLEDRGATFAMPETAKALNPTCMQCKTSDFVMKWAYMGDKNPKAKWDRSSDVHQVVKEAQNPMGCIHCHDPHAAKPRIIRDALIDAVSKNGDNPYAANNDKNAIDVVDIGGWRKIGLLKKAKSNLYCAQCHVEYACNPGFEKADFGKKIGFGDRRTNVYPWKNVFDVLKFYDDTNYRDYQHPATKANMIKFQHPEAESLFTSKHTKAGATCIDCHMGREKAKGGRMFTSHHMVSPRENIKGTCLKCHDKWSEKQAVYMIDSVKNYVRGKMRKAEYWLGVFIDKFAAAEKAGVDTTALNEARTQHDIAHAYWEWWTAENSDGFHNPDEARKSLALSIEASKKGIEILDKAMKPAAQPAAPAPAAK